MRAAIESQIANHNVNRQDIAVAAGVSQRQADRVLALEGTSIRRLLIERRLAKCREALDDPRQRHRGISEIAYGYGFRNLSHFSSTFKRIYGASPNDYRHGKR